MHDFALTSSSLSNPASPGLSGSCRSWYSFCCAPLPVLWVRGGDWGCVCSGVGGCARNGNSTIKFIPGNGISPRSLHSTSLMGLSHLVFSVDAQAWWVAALGARSHTAAGGRKSQGLLLWRDVFDSGRAVVTCQLVSGVGRLAALPGAISISCSLRCGQPCLWREV